VQEQARQQAAHAQYGMQQIGHQVEQRAAGVRGDVALAWELSGLPDEWVMLRGYRNRRGETDHILPPTPGLADAAMYCMSYVPRWEACSSQQGRALSPAWSSPDGDGGTGRQRVRSAAIADADAGGRVTSPTCTFQR
jgi:hypothetical protein